MSVGAQWGALSVGGTTVGGTGRFFYVGYSRLSTGEKKFEQNIFKISFNGAVATIKPRLCLLTFNTHP